MSESIIELRDLVKRYGRVEAVAGVNLEVPRGEIFGLLGPNGAGKTTILRLIGGLLHPTAGKVAVFGLDPRARALDVSLRRSMMIEGPGLHPNLSGKKNLEVFGRLAGLGGARLDEAVEQGLDFAELGSAAGRRVHTYSTGMRQKVAIAVTLLADPELVVLDEPTSGLDPASVVRLRDTLVELRKGRKVTFLISSHHLAEMETLCTRVAILSKGRVLASGAPQDLFPDEPTLYRLAVDDLARARELIVGGSNQDSADTGTPDLEILLRPTEVPALLRKLLEEGVEVYEVRPARSKLEDAYMRFTGDGEGGSP
ncbi:MAG: ABC transporter ATP-binding protein [Planctomycetota bacterium]